MKQVFNLILIFSILSMFACKQSSEVQTNNTASTSDNSAKVDGVGQSNVQDDVSNPNVVQVAIGSKDHTTLVAAVKAAGLVDALSNAGPFTIFAPTNAAFDKLPKGTVDNLLKPENKAALTDVLEYHTYVGVLNTNIMRDGQDFEQVNGQKVKINVKDGKYYVNDSEIVGTVKASNGIIHVINDVLQAK
jgi:uncharacterized surface protein with fasciclin (FAS1) repeats